MSKGDSDSRSPDRTIRRNEHDRIFGKSVKQAYQELFEFHDAKELEEFKNMDNMMIINDHIKRKRELGEKAP